MDNIPKPKYVVLPFFLGPRLPKGELELEWKVISPRLAPDIETCYVREPRTVRGEGDVVAALDPNHDYAVTILNPRWSTVITRIVREYEQYMQGTKTVSIFDLTSPVTA